MWGWGMQLIKIVILGMVYHNKTCIYTYGTSFTATRRVALTSTPRLLWKKKHNDFQRNPSGMTHRDPWDHEAGLPSQVALLRIPHGKENRIQHISHNSKNLADLSVQLKKLKPIVNLYLWIDCQIFGCAKYYKWTPPMSKYTQHGWTKARPII